MNQTIPEFGWWIEVITTKPICIYYFGVFHSITEAEQAKHGYIQDLQQEKAEIINVKIQQCQPKNLTIYKPSSQNIKMTSKREKDVIKKLNLLIQQQGFDNARNFQLELLGFQSGIANKKPNLQYWFSYAYQKGYIIGTNRFWERKFGLSLPKS